MGALDSQLLALALRVVQAVSLLVPRDHRTRWRSEWEAELVHWWRAETRVGRTDPVRLARRTALTISDALRVRFSGGFAQEAAGGAATSTSEESKAGRLLQTPRRSSLLPLGDVVQDARLALRGWRKQPVQSGAILLTLALGIGASTAVFSVLNSVLLNPLPYESADRVFEVDRLLVDVRMTTQLTYAELLELRLRSRTLERAEVLETREGTLGEGESAAAVRVGLASPDLFEALGLSPVHGRGFAEADVAAEAQPVVLLGERTWLARFGEKRDVLGTVLSVDGSPRVVVGVVSEAIRHLRPDVDLWIPFGGASASEGVSVLAWRRADVPAEVARTEIQSIELRDARFGLAHPLASRPGERVAPDTRSFLYASFLAASIVLLIAAVNVAHLMMARTTARRGDVAVRTALGASRARLARAALVESALLTLLGAGLALLLARWSLDVLRILQPDSLRFSFEDVRLDRAVIGYAMLVLTFAVGITGLAPVVDAWRFPPQAMLRGAVGSATVARGRGRMARHSLLIVEVALSVTLLVGAGVLAHSLVRLSRNDPG